MPCWRRLIDGLLDELLAESPAVLLVGSRAAGKTTTALQRAGSVVRLDVPGGATAFRADPDAVPRTLPGPVLLDEWQAVPETFPAVKRAIDSGVGPGCFVLTGSASGDLEGVIAAGTGRIVRVRPLGMTVREVCATRPRLYHLRDTDGRREADIVAELAGERVLAFEVTASSSVTARDARHLAWMRDQLGDRFIGGVVLHTGPAHSRSATGSGHR